MGRDLYLRGWHGDTVEAMPSPESVITGELAIELARMGMIQESSEVGALHHITDLAARMVVGCAGATAVRWSRTETPEALALAASHPDLAEVVDAQLETGAGPVFEALVARDPVVCDDTLVETRWPEVTNAMLRRGVRSFATTRHENDLVLVTLTLYGALPGALDAGQLAMATLLVAQGGAAVSNSRWYDDVNRTAVQLREAVEARAVVDQAKGILMHALRCDADTAFAELRRISQTRHVKLTTVAQRIVSGQGSMNSSDL